MSKDSIPTHSPSVHTEVRMEEVSLFKCEECGEVVKSNSRLIQHLLSHRGATVFCCEECEEVFLSESQLDHHTSALHSDNVVSFECNQCGKCLSSKRGLKKHQLTHCEEKNFKCLECGKEFSTRKNLTQHLRVHSEREFECEDCGIQFKWKGDLLRHKKNIHSGIANYICNECGKGFVRKRHLERHISYSHGEDTKVPTEVSSFT